MKNFRFYLAITVISALAISSCKKDECPNHDKEKQECQKKQSWTNETNTTVEEYSYVWNDSTKTCDEIVFVTHKDTSTYDTCKALIMQGVLAASEYEECNCNEKNYTISYWEKAEDSTGYNYYQWNDSSKTCELIRYNYDNSCEGQLNQGKITWNDYAKCDCESKGMVYNQWNNTYMFPKWNDALKLCELVGDTTQVTTTTDSTQCKVFGMVDRGGILVCECISW